MPTRVILPKLTYEMNEGHIVDWLCKEGDTVAVGQVLFVVETDKAAVEVPAETAGILLRVAVAAGQTVPVSSLLAWIGQPGETVPGEETAPMREQAPASVAQESATAAVTPVARRLARELGVDLADVQAFVGGRRIREADVQAYAEARKAEAHKAEAQQPAAPATDAHSGSLAAATSPLPALQTSTLPAGSLTSDGQSPALGSAAAGDIPYDLQQPTTVQRAMAGHLVQAAAIPQFSAGCEANLTALKALRAELLPGWELALGFRLTYTHLLAALVVRALGDCPTLNASWTGDGIRLYRTVNLGVAMATARGLVVPVVCNAGRLSLAALAGEIVRLQQAAEANRLAPADLVGGTFTLTNVGMLGVALSVPLLNPPQSAILGCGAERSQVVLEDGRPSAVPVAWLTVTADHRVVDGLAAAEFLGRVKALVENPRPAVSMT